MITDEQIMQIAKNYIRHVGSHYINELAIPDNGMIEGFARELIALAQQIKPLEFQDNGYGVLVAESPMGQVRIIGGRRYLRYSGKSFDTEAEAIEAANEDYRKRILSCLVWGGV